MVILTYDEDSVSIFKYSRNDSFECLRIPINSKFRSDCFKNLNHLYLPAPSNYLLTDFGEYKQAILNSLDSLSLVKVSKTKNDLPQVRSNYESVICSLHLCQMIIESSRATIFLMMSTTDSTNQLHDYNNILKLSSNHSLSLILDKDIDLNTHQVSLLFNVIV